MLLKKKICLSIKTKLSENSDYFDEENSDYSNKKTF